VQPSAVQPSAAEERYHRAFAKLARGEREAAHEALAELVALEPDHPLAERARSLLAELERSRVALAAGPADGLDGLGAERASGTARAEMTFFQTLHGLALGAETCVLLECEESQPWVLSLMLGAGAGFGASWLASSDGVRPGFARALTDGTLGHRELALANPTTSFNFVAKKPSPTTPSGGATIFVLDSDIFYFRFRILDLGFT
jgi:hypothetical protein